MARPPRIEFSGALYHVICRGIERRELFRDDVDRQKYLDLLAGAVERFGLRLYAFCLMGNHVHLALETGRLPLSRIMRSLNSSYAGYFNARHRRVGYLFQGRYKAYLVDKEEYLLALIRYIHENPVKARLAEKPGKYLWSSHRLYLGKAPKWLSSGEILKRFGRSRAVAGRNFVAYFAGREERPYGEARRYIQTVVGEEDFARSVMERSEPEALLIRRIEPENLLRWVAREEGVDVMGLKGHSRRRELTRVRALAGYLAREVVRMPLSQIAKVVGKDPSTLWRDVAHLEARMSASRAERERVHRIEAQFTRWGNNT